MKKKEMNTVSDLEQQDDGSEGFVRSRGHRLVDSAMAIHTYAVANLLKRANAPIPWVRGADWSRGGRLASSPLRRFVDGQSQRQALAFCCNFGVALTADECRSIGTNANISRNIKGVSAKRGKTKNSTD